MLHTTPRGEAGTGPKIEHVISVTDGNSVANAPVCRVIEIIQKRIMSTLEMVRASIAISMNRHERTSYLQGNGQEMTTPDLRMFELRSHDSCL